MLIKNNPIEVHKLLIPLKYKIRAHDHILNTFKKIVPTLNSSVQNDERVKALLLKIDSNTVLGTDKKIINGIVNKYDLIKLRNEKKNLFGEKYNSETILRKKWLILKNSLEAPVFTYQGIYFEYTVNKLMEEIFGKDLFDSIEEVLRDGVITTVEQEYILEKASEHNINGEAAYSLLNEYALQNPAFSRIIYEVCKDGIITNVEKQYLSEKATQYNLRESYVLETIERTVQTIKRIHHSFENPDFYQSVLVLFLLKFLGNFDNDIEELMLARTYQYIQDESKLPTEDIVNGALQCARLALIQQSGLGGLVEVGLNNIDQIFCALGVSRLDHESVLQPIKHRYKDLISKDSIGKLFERELDSSPVNIDFKNPVKISGDWYEFERINDQNKPLFYFDIVGDKTIITINESHYFYKDTGYLKLLIITIIDNLKKNYANEDLVDEILYLLNPPAHIRLNYQRKQQ